MDADAVYEQAMADFKQEQLDGGMSPTDYEDALSNALIHKLTALTHHGVKASDAIRRDPERFAADLQSIFTANEDVPADEDATVDLDDMDGGDE
jgi:hypothetical protein